MYKYILSKKLNLKNNDKLLYRLIKVELSQIHHSFAFKTAISFD